MPPGITIRLEKNPDPAQVLALYLEAGWADPGDDASVYGTMMKNSFAVMAAFDEAGKLIGLMRALSDGISDAYLLDLIVTKAHRRQGIGRMLIGTLSEHLSSLGISWIV